MEGSRASPPTGREKAGSRGGWGCTWPTPEVGLSRGAACSFTTCMMPKYTLFQTELRAHVAPSPLLSAAGPSVATTARKMSDCAATGFNSKFHKQLGA